jgi:hypothetical protein
MLPQALLTALLLHTSYPVTTRHSLLGGGGRRPTRTCRRVSLYHVLCSVAPSSESIYRGRQRVVSSVRYGATHHAASAASSGADQEQREGFGRRHGSVRRVQCGATDESHEGAAADGTRYAEQ